MNRKIKFRIWCNNRFYYKCLVGNTTDTNDKNKEDILKIFGLWESDK